MILYNTGIINVSNRLLAMAPHLTDGHPKVPQLANPGVATATDAL